MNGEPKKMRYSELKARLSRISDCPSLEAEIMIEAALGIEPAAELCMGEAELQSEELEKMLLAREARRPLQYIVGKTWFYGGEFKVDESTLIPRPDTELLVERAIKTAKRDARLLDIGTGSGCIPISVLRYRPDIRATAVDISAGALSVARENAERHSVGSKVALKRLDIMSETPEGKYDIVVSNPPYIPRDDIKALEPELSFEPIGALDGGEDGLDFYRRITELAPDLIEDGGYLMLEVGIGEADAVERLGERAGLTPDGRYRDIQGIERVVTFKKRSIQ